MSRDRILFIDDERFFAKPYLRELTPFFEVELACSATAGMDALDKSEGWMALVLDVQMPTPSGVDEYETKNGVDTGIWLLRTKRNEIIKRELPVLILTNRRQSDIEKLIKDMRFRVGQVEVHHKVNTSPKQFLKAVARFMRRPSGREDRA